MRAHEREVGEIAPCGRRREGGGSEPARDRPRLWREAKNWALRPIIRLHLPVLLPEVMEALEVGKGGSYIDATFGAGGYSRALLSCG